MCFTVNGKTECFIVLSPQTNDWSWAYDVVPFVQYALKTYRIDPDRVYLTGLSMGGEGTWLGASYTDNSPNLFAALAPMSGRAAVSDGTSVAGKKIAVWAFHGDADTAIPLAAGQRPITGMIEASANPAPIFTIYPGASHSTTWIRGYTPDHTYHNPNVYEWMLMQRRTSTTARANAAPVVNAGVDQSITLPIASTSLTATATDSDGTIASYTWTQTAGPTAVLTNATTSTLSVSSLVAGTYTFSVNVTDNAGATATDLVNVTVNAAVVNKAPTVEAGEKQYITLPISTATFVAKASDVDGTIVSYTWKRIGGSSTIVMAGINTATLIVSGVVESTYVFRVEVADDKGLKAADTVRLKVSPLIAGRVATPSTSVEETGDQTLSLGQNYPNPFSTRTTIPFSIDESQQVVLRLYNNVGHEVATLLNENLEAGEHQVELNTSSLSNNNLSANSIYFYKLYTKGKVITKKLIVAL